MTDRIIEISDTAAFLSLENHLLKIRLPEQNICTIPVREIQTLILANPAVTATGALLAELAENGCIVVISGQDRLPAAMQLPLFNNYVQTERFHAQIEAPRPLCKRLWQAIVKKKIRNQGELLKKLHGDDFHLFAISDRVLSGDPDNAEARAAVIYWKQLFDVPFVRERTNADNNVLLNYGYAVLRAMAARACCGAGLHPTIGVNHHNRYDAYCLADDLMEPFRTVVDRTVYTLNPENKPVKELTREMRATLLGALLKETMSNCRGNWEITDLLRISAEQMAKSFVEKEIFLNYK